AWRPRGLEYRAFDERAPEVPRGLAAVSSLSMIIGKRRRPGVRRPVCALDRRGTRLCILQPSQIDKPFRNPKRRRAAALLGTACQAKRSARSVADGRCPKSAD